MTEQLALFNYKEATEIDVPVAQYRHVISHQLLGTCALALARWCAAHKHTEIEEVTCECDHSGWTIYVTYR